MFTSTDGGRTWTGLNHTPANVLEWYGVGVDPVKTQRLLGATNWDGRIFVSDNRGRTWQEAARSPSPSVSWRNFVFAPSAPATVYAGTSAFFSAGTFDDRMAAAGIYVSHDSGSTWQPVNDIVSQAANVTDLAVDPQDAQRVYAATGTDGLLKTGNGGQSWQKINSGLPEKPVALSIAVHPINTQLLLAGLDRSGLYRSVNGGQTWQTVAVGLNPEAAVTDIVFRPGFAQEVYMSDILSGVYQSVDGGQTWLPLSDGLGVRAVNKLTFSADGRYLYAATEGGGVYSRDMRIE
jgi:photosystem II stability/assembly factor-like uncharacterized protein